MSRGKSKKVLEMAADWDVTIKPTIAENVHPKDAAVIVHVARFRASKRGRWVKTQDIPFITEAAAEAAMNWFEKRGGVVELYSYKIIKCVQHEVDDDGDPMGSLSYYA